MEYFLEIFLGGLTRGSIYALIALGYTMVYGIIQLIDFAHGEIIYDRRFYCAYCRERFDFNGRKCASRVYSCNCNCRSILVLLRIYYGKDRLQAASRSLASLPLISAIGMSLILQNYVLLAQTSDFLPFPKLIPDLDIMEPYAHIISTQQIFIIITTAIFMMILTLLIKFTKIGKAMRATSQDKIMAALSGIDVNRVISVTFIVGSAAAAIGGVLIASHVGMIHFYMGFIAGIKAFVAAVFGGIGSIPGAVLAD